MREKEREFFISLFGGHILLILCVYAISKKHLQPKRKTLFALRFFHLSRGRREERGRKIKREKRKKEQYTHRINSNLPVECIAGERERVLFLQTGENHPSFTKTIPEIEMRKDLSACNAQAEKHNTQKIIQI